MSPPKRRDRFHYAEIVKHQGPERFRSSAFERGRRRLVKYVTAPIVEPIARTALDILTRPHGIDISYWQQSFRPPEKTPYPVDFAWQRVAYGMAPDGKLNELRADIDNAGVPVRLSYQYVKTEWNMMDQVKYHLGLVDGKGYKGGAQDLEGYGNIWTHSLVEDAINAYLFAKEQTGQPWYIYCNLSFVQTFIQGKFPTSLIDQIDWWAARWYYVVNPAGDPGWPYDWGAWQYWADGNEQGEAYGVETPDIDLDVMNLTYPQFYAKFDVVDDPPEPPEEPKTPEERLDILEPKVSALMGEVFGGDP